MGRSVSYPRNATVAYVDVSYMKESWEWDDFVQDVKDRAERLWPSMYNADTWLGREDHAILQNQNAYLGISEYDGLAAIWLVVKDDEYVNPNLAGAWFAKVQQRFLDNFGMLRKLATFSNGEAMYEQINKPVRGTAVDVAA